MTWQEKRDLIEEVFSGTTLDGQRTGINVDVITGQTNHRYKRWRFKLHGNALIDGVYGKIADCGTFCIALHSKRPSWIPLLWTISATCGVMLMKSIRAGTLNVRYSV